MLVIYTNGINTLVDIFTFLDMRDCIRLRILQKGRPSDGFILYLREYIC
jgi:hypothetical protein